MLNQIAALLRAEVNMSELDYHDKQEAKANAQSFLELMDTRWKIDVTKRALNERKHRRLNKKYMLPSEKDVKTMSDGCKNRLSALYEEFCEKVSSNSGTKNAQRKAITEIATELTGVLMVRLTIYNR